MEAPDTDRLDGLLLSPARILGRGEVLERPSPVPASPGVYAWWFRNPPAPIDVERCRTHAGLVLLYVGISPKAPPADGRPGSRQTLRTRLRYHYAGNAEGSTLRKTLGCLLADELGIELRRVGSGRRMTFGAGESVLSAWMAGNALVSWVVTDEPWRLEARLIRDLDLPLNLDQNTRHAFHPTLSLIRAAAVARARALPVAQS